MTGLHREIHGGVAVPALLYAGWFWVFRALRVPLRYLFRASPSGLAVVPAPEGGSPPVQRFEVVWPGFARLAEAHRGFKVVRGVYGSPAGFGWLVCMRWAQVLRKSLLRDAGFSVAVRCLDETDLVCPAGHVGPPQLDRVVLPEADGTDVVGPGRFVEHQATAARTGVWRRWLLLAASSPTRAVCQARPDEATDPIAEQASLPERSGQWWPQAITQ